MSQVLILENDSFCLSTIFATQSFAAFRVMFDVQGEPGICLIDPNIGLFSLLWAHVALCSRQQDNAFEPLNKIKAAYAAVEQ